MLLLYSLLQNYTSDSFLVMMQAAPAAAEKKDTGAAAAAVKAVEEEATPSHDVYGHLPKPEENNKVCLLSYQGMRTRGKGGGGGVGGGGHIQQTGDGAREWVEEVFNRTQCSQHVHAC